MKKRLLAGLMTHQYKKLPVTMKMWMQFNVMPRTFNIDNCKAVHMGRSNPNTRYYINNQELAVVGKEKDLGVTISYDLNVSEQCHHAGMRKIKPRECWASLEEQSSPGLLTFIEPVQKLGTACHTLNIALQLGQHTIKKIESNVSQSNTDLQECSKICDN